VWINGYADLAAGCDFPNAFHIGAAPSTLYVLANAAQEPVTIASLRGRGDVRSQSSSAAVSPLHVTKLLSPGENSDAGQLTVGVPFSLEEGSEFHVDINGSTAGTLYDQLFIGSAMEIHDSLLSILLADNFAPSAGQQFMLIDNRRAAQYLVAGQFASLPEGAAIDLPTASFRISYIGGDGNDVVLTALPEPSGTVLISLGMLPALRRKRR